MFLVKWFWQLVGTLKSEAGVVGGEDEGEEGSTATDEEGAEGEEGAEEGADGSEGSEGEEGASEDGEGEEGAEGADEGSGKDLGKDRSKYIPRDRFDKVNKTATEAKKLVELGILVEDENGELHINKEVLKSQEKSKEDGREVLDFDKLALSKEEVDESSWPLVEKINKRFDSAKGYVQELSYYVRVLLAENRIIKDYPEFLQKDSPLRKKASEIMKSDKEFQSTYRGKPEAGYWAVKRASELLSGKKPSNEGKPRPKGKFIVGKGDGSGKPRKKVGLMDISNMTKEQLDKLEREEHERLSKLKK